MPVFNEAVGVGDVIADITHHVLDVVPNSELVIVDDRSTDDTLAVLEGIAQHDRRIRVLVNEVNLGHGRTTRRAMDASLGEWIFHLDSDGQVDVSEFALLWALRDQNDLVLGMRVTRHDPVHRLVLTRLTRAMVSVLARHRVRDANVPFKLIHRSLYEHLRPSIPETTFAPSIMIVLGAHRNGARVAAVETTHLPRRHGKSTLHPRRLAAAVGRSALETIDFSRRSVPPYERR
ncbi:MAG: glycosyl transferase family 2 [Ilumatobacteraceae bacterium]|nr:glycosyl transferase family 2 [Ilumatobacteraceae bacterium]